MVFETRRGFKANHAGMAKLLASDLTASIAEGPAKKIRTLASAGAAQYSNTGALASSYRAYRGPGFVNTVYGPHAYWEVSSADAAAAPNEFGGRQGRGPREARRILYKAGLIYHVPIP